MAHNRNTAPPTLPTGLLRFLFRMSVWIYRLGLGRLLGRRFLLIRHIGRKSGKQRETVVEVVRHDPATGVYVVASGYGHRSNWYRNLQQQPRATIVVGGHSIPAMAQLLSPTDSADEMERYAQLHPLAARTLIKVLGYPGDGSPASYRRIGHDHIPFVVFHPRQEGPA